MATSRAYKTDESFLEKISIGAIGTNRVCENLAGQGHRPIELERGSTNFKIWKEIKIKRLRVPDILCVDCGIRIESRAKTKLAITMSHSIADPKRGWDFGLNNNDFIAFVECYKSGERPIDWQASQLVQYISVSSMRQAFAEGKIKAEKPKGVEEGFERRITWYASIASDDSIILEVNPRQIKLKKNGSSRAVSLTLIRYNPDVVLTALVQPGEVVVKSQILASILPVIQNIKCSHSASVQNYHEQLFNLSQTERYAAAKALSYFKISDAIAESLIKVKNTDDHIYNRLEAAATLMRTGYYHEGLDFISTCLKDPYLENRLETVIILGEIKSETSCNLLTQCLLDSEQHPEIRAGAAWALGELGSGCALNALIQSFQCVESNIKIEAARALSKLGQKNSAAILQQFSESSEIERVGIAWAMGKIGNYTLEDLLKVSTDNDTRQWIAYILGMQNPEKYLQDIEVLKHKDPELYFAVTVLWKIITSWINRLEEY